MHFISDLHTYSIIYYHNTISMCFSHIIQINLNFQTSSFYFPVFFSLASSLVSNFVNCAKVAANKFFCFFFILKLLEFLFFIFVAVYLSFLFAY